MAHALSALFDPRRVLVVHGHTLDLLRNRLLDALPERAAGATSISRVGTDAEGRFKPPAGKFDLALLLVPDDHLLTAVRCAAEHAVARVLVAPGDTPIELTQACHVAADAGGCIMLGPHAFGMQRAHLQLNASLAETTAAPGGIAVISQSTSLTLAILDWAADTRAGFSLVSSAAPEGPVGVAQLLDFCATDTRTTAVALYMDTMPSTPAHTRRFMSALRACAASKPVVVLKPTGDGPPTDAPVVEVREDEAVFNTALSRAGAVRVWFFIQMFSAIKLLGSRQRPQGRRLAILSNSAAAARMAVDWGQRVRVRSRVTELSSTVSGAKSADVAQAWSAQIRRALADEANDGVLIMVTPTATLTDAVIEELAALGKARTEAPDKPLLACVLGDARARPLRQIFEKHGIPALRTPEAAVDAFGNLASFRYNQELLQQIPAPFASTAASHAPADLEGARALMQHALDHEQHTLTGVTALSILSAIGLPVARAAYAADTTAAIMAAQQIGFPIVMKVQGEGIIQKSRGGGVALDLRNSRELQDALVQIKANAQRAYRGATVSGVLVQQMVTDSTAPDDAPELMLRVQRHRLFGPVISFGAGGTAAHLIDDAASELAPLNRFLAQRLIERTRVAQVLANRPDADQLMTGLQNLLLAVSEAVCELPQLTGIDINPIMVADGELKVADATLQLSREPIEPRDRYAHMVIHPYPADLVREATMRSGERYVLRPIRPEDARALQAFVKNDLSEESRYMRFISSMKELTPSMLKRYTQIDYDREMALVATLDDPQQPGTERIIGVSRWLLNRDATTAEYALAVGDGHQRQGVGGALMRMLEEVARKKHLKAIEGFVLNTNDGMLGLMTGLGYKSERYEDDPSMRRVWKALE
ncbi:MAG TPA: GNAT family N-acetyltransferase [Burkholderiaceae bacterium]|nr:GNAT family N-acetyltransferase [Burkholderiaceae bacterium]